MQILYEKIRPLESLTPAQRKSYEVIENTSKRSVQGLLITETIGRSALVIAYNSKTMEGLMGRFTDTHIGRDGSAPDKATTEGGLQFDKALRRIAGLGPSRETHIWLGGVSLYDRVGKPIPGGFDERRYIQSRVDAIGPLAGLTVEWTQEAHEDVHAQLNPEGGTLHVEKIRLPGHFLDQLTLPES